MSLISKANTGNKLSFTTFNTAQNAKDVLIQEGLVPENVHPGLLRSWLRSRQYNIDPFVSAAPTVSYNPKNDMDGFLIQIIKPYCNYLKSLLSMSDSVFALLNSDGVIIFHTEPQNSQIKKSMDKHNCLVNSLWDEISVGTNPFNIALEEKKAILMQGHEYFSYSFDPYGAASSPIFHPQSKDVIGVLGLLGFRDTLNLHSLGLTTTISQIIEVELGKRIQSEKTINQSSKAYFFSNNPADKNRIPGVIGKDPVFLSALKLAHKAAKTDLSILLTGETGTGKEVLAKVIHENSPRAQGPFVAVNCGAIPKDLMVSELYGYLDGAFTGASRRGYPGRFEQAHGGTIFLDEIGDASYDVQVGLLRVIEEGCVSRLGSVLPTPVNVRVLAATSRDLTTLVQEGIFRLDLYYRLAGININLPPLRKRKEDIPLLVEYFLDKIRERTSTCYAINNELIEALQEHDWPGNVREFKNMIERLAMLAENEELCSEHFYQIIPPKKKSNFRPDPKKAALIEAIMETGGNISRAAEKLGVNRLTVYRRMKSYGIEKEHLTL